MCEEDHIIISPQEIGEKKQSLFRKNYTFKDLKIGDYVKLGFNTEKGQGIGRELMWIVIDSIDEEGSQLLGSLSNIPKYKLQSPIQYGDQIVFEYDDIFDFLKKNYSKMMVEK